MKKDDEVNMVELDNFELSIEVTQVNEKDDFLSNTSFWLALKMNDSRTYLK